MKLQASRLFQLGFVAVLVFGPVNAHAAPTPARSGAAKLDGAEVYLLDGTFLGTLGGLKKAREKRD